MDPDLNKTVAESANRIPSIFHPLYSAQRKKLFLMKQVQDFPNMFVIFLLAHCINKWASISKILMDLRILKHFQKLFLWYC